MGNSGTCAIILDMNKFEVPAEAPKMQMDWIEIGGQFADYRQLESTNDPDMKFSGVPRFHNYPLDLELSFKSDISSPLNYKITIDNKH